MHMGNMEQSESRSENCNRLQYFIDNSRNDKTELGYFNFSKNVLNVSDKVIHESNFLDPECYVLLEQNNNFKSLVNQNNATQLFDLVLSHSKMVVLLQARINNGPTSVQVSMN